jgi:cation transport regulator ChaB
MFEKYPEVRIDLPLEFQKIYVENFTSAWGIKIKMFRSS